MSTTAKVTQEQKDMMRLIDRSSIKSGGGWVKCAEKIGKFLLRLPEELADREIRDGVVFMKLTETGQAIVDWT